MALISLGGMEESAVVSCAAFIAVLTVICFYFRIPFGSPEDEEPLAKPRSSSIQLYMAKCMRLADLYQLSPREGEILCYLARGRNAKHIAEELVISEHTAKSHIYRIYNKMNVHSRQDLIDLVEEGFPGESSAAEEVLS